MLHFTAKWSACAVLLATLQGCQQDQRDPAAKLACGAVATSIQLIQGLASESELQGSEHTVEAVVIHWLPQSAGGSVFVQDSDADPLNDASSGLLIDLSNIMPTLAPQPGRLLRIAGTVIESNGQTGLKAHQLTDCGQQALPAPRTIASLPLKAGMLENFEGMRIELQMPLTIADLYGLQAGRFMVASGGRVDAPTEVAKPGAPARAVAASNSARTLTVIAPPDSIQLDSLPRRGDLLNTSSGVLGQWRDSYQLYLDQAPQFQQLNPRRPAPERAGSVRISSFNVLNYFNGDGKGGGFPTPRGANSPAEFERQQAKILAAMQAIDADIFALAEIENDGYQQYSAISQLTAALNASTQRSYAFVHAPGGQLGGDSIAVGLLYDSAILKPKGQAMAIVDAPFDQHHRPPLIQSFVHLATGRVLTVVALHLKSKRCNGPQGKNVDLGDGQSCWNAARVEATRFLADWLTRNPAADIEQDNILILGDFNAHSREDPLTALIESGFVRIVPAASGHHSFVFQGQTGALDHGFASPGLAAIASASVWHINADEAPWLDYNLENKSVEDDALLYRPDPYRSSDHDPLIIDLAF